MDGKVLAVGSALVLVFGGLAGAFVAGIGPLGTESDGDTSAVSTATADGDASTGEPETESATPPFGFSVDAVEECGQTCRDVTSTLTNRQDRAAENVTVYTRIYAGQGTDGDVVWEGTEAVGSLAAGDSYTTTRRVDLSYGDAYAIEQEGGWVTVQTTVETADGTVVFSDERQVS